MHVVSAICKEAPENRHGYLIVRWSRCSWLKEHKLPNRKSHKWCTVVDWFCYLGLEFHNQEQLSTHIIGRTNATKLITTISLNLISTIKKAQCAEDVIKWMIRIWSWSRQYCQTVNIVKGDIGKRQNALGWKCLLGLGFSFCQRQIPSPWLVRSSSYKWIACDQWCHQRISSRNSSKSIVNTHSPQALWRLAHASIFRTIRAWREGQCRTEVLSCELFTSDGLFTVWLNLAKHGKKYHTYCTIVGNVVSRVTVTNID